ncbi:FKBP-type peptidyl-prolyl cis-trans isomerase [Pseudokineococcus sp. 1T1Z-3]|uniref:FKBP-type peptidyl-prolyl cis-trans isomerase n=1 Tax=Pseudokineococcus sp. 1T1Z-3 TaxID=3132745 RepID=UPI00309E7BA4
MRHLPHPARALAAAASCLLLVAACGSGESTSTPLDRVDVVSDGGDGEAPELQLETPVTVAETSVEVLEQGEGRTVEEGDLVALDVLAVDGGSGEVLSSTFEGPTRLTLLADPSTTVQGLLAGVIGQQEGSRVLVAVSPADFPSAQGGAATPEEGDGSVVLLVDVQGSVEVPDRASGVAQPPVDGLPQVTLADDGAPTIAVPEGDPPTELRVETLVEGEGEPTAPGDTVAVQYQGVLWSDGSEFDSTWSSQRPPFVFTLGAGQVIPAWDSGLAGVPVGSQVLVVAPPDQAYGDQENGGIPGGSTLVFVVDVLAALPAVR